MTYRDSNWQEEKKALLAEIQSLKDQLKLIEDRHKNNLSKFEYTFIDVPSGNTKNVNFKPLAERGWRFIAFSPNGYQALFERPAPKTIDWSEE